MLTKGATPVTVPSIRCCVTDGSIRKMPLGRGRMDIVSPMSIRHISGVSAPSGTSSTKISSRGS